MSAQVVNIFIPDSVTSIGEGAFSYCTSLISITIPDGVTSVKNLFLGCSGLSRISGRYATYDNRCYIIDGVLTAFAPAGLISYTIPYEVISIGYAAFASCDCASLTNITIPNSVTSIEDYAFYECYGLTSVTIPNSVTSIGIGAFVRCSGLTDVTIGDSVTSIGKSAFHGCTSLTSVYCKTTTPPAGDSYMFADNATGRKIYVPRNSVEAYKSAEYWKNYANNIVGYDF